MKAINEMTDEEILSLVDDDILFMIKLKKAQEGIKMIERPTEPEYLKVAPPDLTVYTSSLFGDTLAFVNSDDLEKVMKLISDIPTKGRLDYEWSKLGSDVKFFSFTLNKYGGKWADRSSQDAYSENLYNQITSAVLKNKTLKEHYEKELKEYNDSVANSKWIEDEINGKVLEVKIKQSMLFNYCIKFKNEYLPLAENDNVIAANFLVKAYNLSADDLSYVLANYNIV